MRFRNPVPAGFPRPRLRFTGLATIAAGLAVMLNSVVPGVVLTRAAGITDVGNAGEFELDGNTAQNAPAQPPFDWETLFNNSGPGGSGAAVPIASPDFVTSAFQSDYALPDHSYFTSSKDTLDLSGWGCTVQSNVLAKDEVFNAYGAVFEPESPGPREGHILVYLAAERASNLGDAFTGFWLMQKVPSCTPTADGGNGKFTGSHTVGDLLVLADYTNGGTISTLQIYKWVGGANPLSQIATGLDCTAVLDPTTNNTCGRVNDAALTTPWQPGHTTPLGPSTFLEMGVDLTNVYNNLGTPIPCDAGMIAESRSSQQTTAELKDYASAKLSICRPTTTGTQLNPAPVGGQPSQITVGGSANDTATISGGTTDAFGTVTYHIYSGSGSGACVAGNEQTGQGFPAQVTVTNGSVPPSPSFTFNTPGSYEWQAIYSGDFGLPGPGGDTGVNKGSTSVCGSEPLTVNKVTPTLATQASATVNVGGTISDQANITKGFNPGDALAPPAANAGTVSWNLYGPFPPGTVISSGSCDTNHDLTSKLSAGFTHHAADVKTSTTATYNSPTYTPAGAGIYVWVAHYLGNADNNAVDGACTDANETVSVTGPMSSLAKTERDLGPAALPTDDPVPPPNYVTNLATALTGDVIQYKLTYSNGGNGPASAASVTDVIPSGTVFDAGSCLPAAGWLCSFDVPSSTVTFSHATDIAAGTANLAVGTFKVKITAVAPIVVSNTGNVTTTQETTKIPSNTVTIAGPLSSLSKGERDLGPNATPGSDPAPPPNYVTNITTAVTGDVLQYQLTYVNSGSAAAQNVDIVDPVPAGTTLLSGGCLPAPGWTCILDFVNHTASFTIGSVAPNGPNGVVAGTFKVTITATGDYTISNSGSVTDSVETTPIHSNTVTATGPASSLSKGERDLGPNAGAADNPASPSYVTSITTALTGDVLQYQLVYTNSGAAAANNVMVSDSFPANTSFVSGSCLSAFPCVVGASSVTFDLGIVPATTANVVAGTFKVKITGAAPFTITNLGHVTNTPVETTPIASNSVTATGPKSALAKAERDLGNNANVNPGDDPGAPGYVTNITTALAGDVLQYQLTYTNSGSAHAANVSVTDVIPASTVYYNPGNVSSCLANSGAGWSCNDSVAGQITFSNPDVAPNGPGGVVVGTFKVVIQSPGAFTVSNHGSVTTTAETTAINSNVVTATGPISSLSKAERDLGPGALPGSDPAAPAYGVSITNAITNDVLQYQLTYTNSGTAAAQNVTIVDPVPAGTTLLSGGCLPAPGWTCILNFVTNTASFTIGSVAPNGPNGVVAGTFKVTITAPAPFTITNAAGVTTQVETTSIPSNTVTAVGPLSAVTKAERDLGPGAAAATDPAAPAYVTSITNALSGDVLQYQLTYTNQGTGPATNVSITDTFPTGSTFLSGSCLVANGFACAPGANGVTYTIASVPANTTLIAGTFKVTISATGAFTISNVAGVTADREPGSQSNAVNAVGPLSSVNKDERDLGQTATAGSDPATPGYVTSIPNAVTGDIIQYRLTYTNSGNGAAPNVSITDSIPAGTTLVSGSCLVANGFACVPGAGSITLTNPSVGPTTTVVAGSFKVKITAAAPFTLTNVAGVTTTTEGHNPPPSNTVTAVGPLSAITKAERDLGKGAGAADNPATPAYVTSITNAVTGDVIQYQISYINQGSGPATGIAVSDTIPTGASLVSGSCLGVNGFVCVPGTNQVVFNLANAAAGTNVLVGTFKVTITAAAPFTVTNVAGVTTNEQPLDPSNSVSATGPLSSVSKAERDLGATAGATDDPATPAYVTQIDVSSTGDVIQYQLTYHNTGTGPASNVVVSDNVPTGTAFVDGSCLPANGFACTPPGTQISYTIGSVAANTSVVAGTFKVKITAAAPYTLTNVAGVASAVEGVSASNSVGAVGPVAQVSATTTPTAVPTTGADLPFRLGGILILLGGLMVLLASRRRRGQADR